MNFKLKSLRFVCFTALAMCISILANEPKGTNIYNPAGKRDPFKVLVLGSAQRKPTAIYPTEKYDLEQLTLKAILRVQGKSRAMVQAPDGQTFVIVEGEVVGRERATLSRILKTEIIFTQKTFNYLGNSSLIERVLSLPPEQVSLATDLVSPEKKNEEVQNKKAVGVAKKKNEPKIPDFNGVGDINKVNESLQKVMNRPAELEKQLDEMIGK